jgi:hypothetical protein
MVAMTSPEQSTESDRLLIIDDLEELPSVQLRYELDDGR